MSTKDSNNQNTGLMKIYCLMKIYWQKSKNNIYLYQWWTGPHEWLYDDFIGMKNNMSGTSSSPYGGRRFTICFSKTKCKIILFCTFKTSLFYHSVCSSFICLWVECRGLLPPNINNNADFVEIIYFEELV